MKRWGRTLSFASCLAVVLGTARTSSGQTISSISPIETTAGAPAFTLTVNGTLFYAGDPNVPQSKVEWDGVELTTTFVNTSQLKAAVPASLVASAGTATIRVKNPILSNGVNFTINPSPKITTTSTLPLGTVGRSYSLRFTASGGTSPLTWYKDSGALPPGLTLSSAGQLSGTPTDVGEYTFSVGVKDKLLISASKAFSITITFSPIITTDSPLPDGKVGTLYSKTFEAEGGFPPYSWSISADGGDAPPGLKMSSGGVLSGKPTVAGTFQFTVRVRDSQDRPGLKGFTMIVQGPPFEVTTPSLLPTGIVGASYSKTLTATNGTPPYSWSVFSGAVPGGLNLSSDGVLSGTPTTIGVFDFTVRVLDFNLASAIKAFSLTIGLTDLTIQSASPLPSGFAGLPYSYALAASGGSPAYIWSIESGTLPRGLALSGSGVLSGTPASAGAFNFTIRVTDSVKDFVTKAFTLTVETPSYQISTPTPLPKGMYGVAYSQTLTAVSGKPPYDWTVTAGKLPPGLSLSEEGVLKGTPAAGGKFNFTVQVRDASGATAEKAFELVIEMPPVSAVSVTGLNNTIDPAQQPAFGLSLASGYLLAIRGTITLSVRPETAPSVNDPAIQFASGGRTLDFTIPAGQTQATFPVSPVALQSGTVASTITLAVRLTAGGVDITPSPAPARSVRVTPSPPVITSLILRRTSSGFEAEIAGFSTPRQITQAKFRFAGAPLSDIQPAEVTVDVNAAFGNWYRSTPSAQYGSTFRYTQPFAVQGSANAVSSVTVTLANGQGVSQPISRTF